MEFEFDDDFARQNRQSKQSTNMEQIIDKLDKNSSVNWDDFGIGNVTQSQQPSIDRSYISDLFNRQRQQPTQNIQSVNNSRNLSQISYESGGRGFQFDQSVRYQNTKDNQRYEKLQKLLSQAKGNNLEAFYRNLDQMTEQKRVQDIEFTNRGQFDRYIATYKQSKKRRQIQYQQQHAQKNQFAKMQQQRSIPIQNENYNFQKKPSNLLSAEFESDDQEGNDKELQMKNSIQDGQEFFDLQPKSKILLKKAPSKQKLPSIRQQKQNVFQKTAEQEAMTKILSNYKEMKDNFNTLMQDLKRTGQGQEHIVEELKKMKQDYRMKQEKQLENRRKQKMEKDEKKKNQQANELKQQIQAVKVKNDEILLTRMNQKIQQLQSLVKRAVEDVVKVKQTKMVPTIINYYEQQISLKNSNDAYLSEDINSSYSQQQNRQYVNKSIEYSPEIIKSKIKKSRISGLTVDDNFASPFQLDLSGYADRSNVVKQQLFKPDPNAKEYFPKTLRNQNRNLRKCLTQKSSLIFQSFEFHISGKFTIQQDELCPVFVQLRVGNKCAIDLLDILVIVYGPQGCDLLTKPTSRIYYEQLKYNSFFMFEVCLNKQCLLQNGFTVQISYRTDSMHKKKVNFKVVLPICYLIRPEFIYQTEFVKIWDSMDNQFYIRPNTLNFHHIRTHEDIKLILPFIHIDQPNVDTFSYGLMFKLPKIQTLYMLKLCCYVNGKASIHLKTDKKAVDINLKHKLMDILNYLFMVSTN